MIIVIRIIVVKIMSIKSIVSKYRLTDQRKLRVDILLTKLQMFITIIIHVCNITQRFEQSSPTLMMIKTKT